MMGFPVNQQGWQPSRPKDPNALPVEVVSGLILSFHVYYVSDEKTIQDLCFQKIL